MRSIVEFIAMHKKVISSGIGFLLVVSPLVAFGYTDCRDKGSWDDCSLSGLIEISQQTFLTIQDRTTALQKAVQKLLAQIGALKTAQQSSISCFVPTYDLYIGRTDAETNGEVKKLQLWLKAEGYFPDAQGTGFYGEKTAAAVVKWQKAHGMDFVTIKSGVGKMTRAKIAASCGQSTVTPGWETYRGDGFEFQYPKDTLALYPITQSIYSENPKYTGQKLILQSRVASLGKLECPDGGKGETVICSVAGADGISFLVAENSVANVTAPLEKSLLSAAIVGGKQVIVFEHGAEGDGARMHFVPLGPERTLIVYQRYSCCLAELSFPKGLVEKVLATLKFTDSGIKTYSQIFTDTFEGYGGPYTYGVDYDPNKFRITKATDNPNKFYVTLAGFAMPDVTMTVEYVYLGAYGGTLLEYWGSNAKNRLCPTCTEIVKPNMSTIEKAYIDNLSGASKPNTTWLLMNNGSFIVSGDIDYFYPVLKTLRMIQ